MRAYRIFFLSFIGLIAVSSIGYSAEGESPQDEVLTQKIDSILNEVKALQVGMTRSDILKLFGQEGGISDRFHRTYVYRSCSYIKIDFEFRSAGASKNPRYEEPTDVITKMSKPYLEWSIND